MSFSEVTRVKVECDSCGRYLVDDLGTEAFPDSVYAAAAVKLAGWRADSAGGHSCPRCEAEAARP